MAALQGEALDEIARKTIPQQALRNDSGAILRQAESGERFLITRARSAGRGSRPVRVPPVGLHRSGSGCWPRPPIRPCWTTSGGSSPRPWWTHGNGNGARSHPLTTGGPTCRSPAWRAGSRHEVLPGGMSCTADPTGADRRGPLGCNADGQPRRFGISCCCSWPITLGGAIHLVGREPYGVLTAFGICRDVVPDDEAVRGEEALVLFRVEAGVVERLALLRADRLSRGRAAREEERCCGAGAIGSPIPHPTSSTVPPAGTCPRNRSSQGRSWRSDRPRSRS